MKFEYFLRSYEGKYTDIVAAVEQDDSAMSSSPAASTVNWSMLAPFGRQGHSQLWRWRQRVPCSTNNTAIFHMVQTSNTISIINTKPHAQPKEKNNGQYLVVKFFQFVTQKYED